MSISAHGTSAGKTDEPLRREGGRYGNPTPTQHLHGRAALAPVFDELNAYVATMHFNGQSTTTLDGERAAGVAYCLAHHVKVDGPERSMMTAAIRYLDAFVKHDGTWYFSERKLMGGCPGSRRS